MSTEGGTRAIVAALAANAGIAAAKFVGFLVTGSASLLAEAVHSLADTSNQGLLLVGKKTSQRAASGSHPFGYGRDRYFYSFVVALLLFTVGALFAGYEGIHKIAEPAPLTSPLVAVAILLVAIVLEAFSFRTAVAASRPLKGSASWWAFIRQATVPELPVVLLEDAGALVGLVFALVGVGMAVLTGDPVWDGVGTLGIGLLLGTIAIVLIVETKSLLIGEGARPETLRAITAALVGGPVQRVIHLRTQYLGPEELLVGAKIAVPATLPTGQVAAAIDAAEARLRAAVPAVRIVYLEPDLDRTAAPAAPPR